MKICNSYPKIQLVFLLSDLLRAGGKKRHGNVGCRSWKVRFCVIEKKKARAYLSRGRKSSNVSGVIPRIGGVITSMGTAWYKTV